MVERVTLIVRPPTQAVAPMPQQNEEEAAPAAPVDPPTQVEAPPQGKWFNPLRQRLYLRHKLQPLMDIQLLLQ